MIFSKMIFFPDFFPFRWNKPRTMMSMVSLYFAPEIPCGLAWVSAVMIFFPFRWNKPRTMMSMVSLYFAPEIPCGLAWVSAVISLRTHL
jgi:hypothetical protein